MNAGDGISYQGGTGKPMITGPAKQGGAANQSGSGGMGVSDYVNIGVAAIGTVGVIMDWLEAEKNKEKNNQLMQLQMHLNERNRDDILKQQDFTNNMTTKNFALLRDSTEHSMKLQDQGMNMKVQEFLTGILRGNTALGGQYQTGASKMFTGA